MSLEGSRILSAVCCHILFKDLCEVNCNKMPTRAELTRSNPFQETYSWTDDLPVCRLSGNVAFMLYIMADGKLMCWCIYIAKKCFRNCILLFTDACIEVRCVWANLCYDYQPTVIFLFLRNILQTASVSICWVKF